MIDQKKKGPTVATKRIDHLERTNYNTKEDQERQKLQQLARTEEKEI
jgi:hypothetical protein